MAIIGALAKGLARGAGGAMARNITGRKKTVNPSAIAPKQNVQGQQQKKGGALVKSPTAGITKTMAPVKQISTGAVAKDDHLGNIHKNVLLIESIVTGVYKAEKDNLKEKKQSEKNDARKEKENRLETKPDKVVKKKPTLAQLPKLGVFGWIKRFLGNILAGLFLMKMVDFAKFLPKIIRAIDSITTFIADFGLKLVDALVTFLDFGVKAYDFTIGNIKKLGGNLFGENADKILGLVETAIFLTTAIATSMAAEALMGGGGDGFGDQLGKGKNKFRGVTQGRGGSAPRTRIPGTGPTVTQGRGGVKPGTRIPGTRPRITGGTPKGGFRLPSLKGINAGSFAKGGASLGISVGLEYLMGLGFSKMDAMRIQGTVDKFNSSSPDEKRKMIAKYDKLVKKYTEKTQGIEGAFDSFVTLGGLLGPSVNQSLLRKYQATRAALVAAQSESDKIKKYQEGGRVTKVKRGIDIKKKRKRKLRVVKPSREILPPLPTVDESKVDDNQLEENNRAWWDFLGWAGTGNAEEPLGQGGKILAEKTRKVGDQLGKNDYFGPILRVASKVILDQEVSSRDYTNIGRGINLLMDDGVTKGKIGLQGFNEGGLAKNLQFNVTQWVSKTFENSLREDLKKKYLPNSKYGSTSGPGSTPGSRDSATGELVYTSGPAGSSGDTLTMARNLMRDLNLTEAQAAGIVGNMIAESGVENARPQNTPSGTKGPLVVDGVTGYGIVQWTSKGRQQKLYDFAKNKGHDMSKPLTMDIEYQFFLKEFRGDYGYVLDQIRKAKTVKESSTIFMQQYEVPAGYRTNAKIMERYNMSQPVYEKLSSGQGTATEGKGTYIAPQNVTAPDLSGTEQGEGNEATAKLLKDFPQIKTRGSAQQIYASGLGHYLKTVGAGRGKGIGDYGDPQPGKTHQMEHPDHGGIVARHRGTGHHRGVALDLGANSATMGSYRDDQKKLWPFISRYLKKYGLNKEPFIPQVLHGRGESFSPVGPRSGADGGHNDHFHVEFHKGGLVGGSGLVNALLKTGEMVIDVDSTGPAKDLLLAINQASGKEGIIKAIRDYAPYDARAEQTVIVPEESGEMPQEESYGNGSPQMAMIPLPMDTSNPFEFLEYQG